METTPWLSRAEARRLLKQDKELDGELRTLEGEQARSARSCRSRKNSWPKNGSACTGRNAAVARDNSAQAQERSMSSIYAGCDSAIAGTKAAGLLSRLAGLQFEKARAAAGGKVSKFACGTRALKQPP